MPVISRMISLPSMAAWYSRSNRAFISWLKGFGSSLPSLALPAARAIWSAMGISMSELISPSVFLADSIIFPAASIKTGSMLFTCCSAVDFPVTSSYRFASFTCSNRSPVR